MVLCQKNQSITYPGKDVHRIGKMRSKSPAPSPTVFAAAKKAHAYIVMGMSEADPLFPGTVYISQLFISEKGEIMGVHRKLVPTNIEKLIYTGGTEAI